MTKSPRRYEMIFAVNTLTVGEKFSVGGVTTLLGLGMTFVVLALLIGCILLVGFSLKQINKIHLPQKKRKNDVAPEPVAVPVVDAPAEIDPETMLAIESAVKTYVRENSSDGKPHENVTIKSVVKR